MRALRIKDSRSGGREGRLHARQHAAREADVDVVVTGPLLRAGSGVRVTTQLTDGSNGTLLWSNTSQAPLATCFACRTSGPNASLALPLTRREQRRLAHDVPAHAAAYEYFRRG
jgi:hypothetical protein